MKVRYDIVVPTIGRSSLTTLLDALDGDDGPTPGRLVVVDDRPDRDLPLDLHMTTLDVEVIGSGGRGPAAARNAGWRRCTAPWIVFLDDDVVPRHGWRDLLVRDLHAATSDEAAVQGRVHVPLPDDRRPTDRERNVARLGEAVWITADMAVRRQALHAIGGFDERFTRAYREDTDLALRLFDEGWQIGVGERRVDHPVPPAPWSASIRSQRGNADDALMRRLHGPDWRARGRAPAGMLGHHVTTTAVSAVTAIAAIVGHRRLGAVAAGLWSTRATRFWWQRVRPGPRDRAELVRMAITSAAIPPAATAWAVRGWLNARRLAPHGPADRWGPPRTDMVLFDRDGTLVEDVPYNGDPAQVRLVPGAFESVARLRAAGIAVGMVTNQSGVAHGIIDAADVEAVNAEVERQLGPFVSVKWCPHGPADGCGCRKPRPGMIVDACESVGIPRSRCTMIGDAGADVDAALAAGARAILVPTRVTEPGEIRIAPVVASSLRTAIDMVLGGENVVKSHRAPEGTTPRPVRPAPVTNPDGSAANAPDAMLPHDSLLPGGEPT